MTRMMKIAKINAILLHQTQHIYIRDVAMCVYYTLKKVAHSYLDCLSSAVNTFLIILLLYLLKHCIVFCVGVDDIL